MQVLDTIKQKFYAYGWLMPALLPLTEVIGRAVYNFVFYVYFIWAFLALAYWPRLKRLHWMIYFGMLVAFALSVLLMPTGAEQMHSLEKFVKYVMHTWVFFITLKALESDTSKLEQLFNAIAKIAIITIALILVKLGWAKLSNLNSGVTFDVFEIFGRNTLPWLVPIILSTSLLKMKSMSEAWGNALLVLGVILFETYVQARTALLSVLVGSGFYFLLRFRFKLMAMLSLLALLAVLIFSLNPNLYRGANLQDGVWGYLDKFTTGRSILWRQAIETPPPSIWFGVGFSNVDGKSNVTYIKHDTGIEKVKHLHNMFLDCWYETGLVGLITFLFWLVYHFNMLRKILQSTNQYLRAKGVTLLSSCMSLLTFGMLSQGHSSNFLSIYLFLLFAMTTHVYNAKD
jgi:teichuronic acid biosynthesis protein TuaE